MSEPLRPMRVFFQLAFAIGPLSVLKPTPTVNRRGGPAIASCSTADDPTGRALRREINILHQPLRHDPARTERQPLSVETLSQLKRIVPAQHQAPSPPLERSMIEIRSCLRPGTTFATISPVFGFASART